MHAELFYFISDVWTWDQERKDSGRSVQREASNETEHLRRGWGRKRWHGGASGLYREGVFWDCGSWEEENRGYGEREKVRDVLLSGLTQLGSTLNKILKLNCLTVSDGMILTWISMLVVIIYQPIDKRNVVWLVLNLWFLRLFLVPMQESGVCEGIQAEHGS